MSNESLVNWQLQRADFVRSVLDNSKVEQYLAQQANKIEPLASDIEAWSKGLQANIAKEQIDPLEIPAILAKMRNYRVEASDISVETLKAVWVKAQASTFLKRRFPETKVPTEPRPADTVIPYEKLQPLLNQAQQALRLLKGALEIKR